MRSLPIGFVLLWVLAAAQSTIVAQFHWLRGRPDLILLVVLTWSLVSDRSDALAWAFVGGLLIDTLSGGPMGASVLGLVVVSLMAGLTESRLWESHVMLPLVAVAIGTIVFHLIYLSALAITGWPTDWMDALASVTLPTTALNLVLTIPTYRGARWLASQLWAGEVAI